MPNDNVHDFPYNQGAGGEILTRLAIVNELVQMARLQEQEEDLPPRYSIAVANSQQLSLDTL